MLSEVKRLHGLVIHAQDGEVGILDDLLFDDKQWTVRYLVVKTGSWLAGRRVLVSPIVFGVLDWDERTLRVNVSRERIGNSPEVDPDEPISGQFERDYFEYQSWPNYWGSTGVWGSYWYPAGLLPLPIIESAPRPKETLSPRMPEPDHILRSTKQVRGFRVSARDGEIGAVEDFVVDVESWRVSYLAVDIQELSPGKNTLLPHDWIGGVDWPGRNIKLNTNVEQIRDTPEWRPGQQISAAFQNQLYGYYARQRSKDREANELVSRTRRQVGRRTTR